MTMPDTKDLLWRLRQSRWHGTDWGALMAEAADEIARLRASTDRAITSPPVSMEMLDEVADIISKHLAHQLSTQESWMFLRQARDKLREATALLRAQSSIQPTNVMPRQRGPEGEPFDCPQPITCQFPRCDCGAPTLAGPSDIDLMQRVWANLYYNEEEAGNTFQQTLNEVVDWLAARNALPPASKTSGM